MAFSSADHGGQQGDFFSLVFLKNIGNNFFLTPFHHFLPGIIGVGFSDPGIEQADEIIDLGHGTHGGAGIFIGGLLFNGDHG